MISRIILHLVFCRHLISRYSISWKLVLLKEDWVKLTPLLVFYPFSWVFDYLRCFSLVLHYMSWVPIGLLDNVAFDDSQELKQYPALRVEVSNAAIESLDRMKDTSKKATLQLVDMECSYLTVDFFRKLPQDVDKGGNPTHSIFDRYNDSYLRRIGKFNEFIFALKKRWVMVSFLLDSLVTIADLKSSHWNMRTGSTVLSYVNMVCASLRNSIPKSIVYCQVREAKRSLLDHFFTELGKLEVGMKIFFNCYLCLFLVKFDAVADVRWMQLTFELIFAAKAIVIITERGSCSHGAPCCHCKETWVVQECTSRNWCSCLV